MRHYTMALLLLVLGIQPGISQSSNDLGIASYYSDDFHGHKTASGELYDKNALTAAHKELPIGTIIQVTRLDNRKSVKVRVNDRGPYIKGRIVEVSKKAAERLDLLEDGLAEVRVEVLRNGSSVEETPVAVTTPPPPPAPEPKVKEEPKVNKRPKLTDYDTSKDKSERLTVKKPAVDKKAAAPKEKATLTQGTPKAGSSKAAAVADGALDTEIVTSKDYKPSGLYKIELSKPKNYGFGVQVAAVSNHAGMMQQVAELQGKWFKNILVNIEDAPNGKTHYKIILGSFKDRTTANNYKKRLKRKKNINGFVVDLSDLNKDG